MRNTIKLIKIYMRIGTRRIQWKHVCTDNAAVKNGYMYRDKEGIYIKIVDLDFIGPHVLRIVPNV